MSYRILWQEGQTQTGYFADVDQPTLQAAVWAVATTVTAGNPNPGGNLPVLIDVQDLNPPMANPPAALPEG